MPTGKTQLKIPLDFTVGDLKEAVGEKIGIDPKHIVLQLEGFSMGNILPVTRYVTEPKQVITVAFFMWSEGKPVSF